MTSWLRNQIEAFSLMRDNNIRKRNIILALAYLAAANITSICTVLYLIAFDISGVRSLDFEFLLNTILLTTPATAVVSVGTLRILNFFLAEPNVKLVIITASVGTITGYLWGSSALLSSLASMVTEHKALARWVRCCGRTLLGISLAVALALLGHTVVRLNIFELVTRGVYAQSVVSTSFSFMTVCAICWGIAALTKYALRLVSRIASSRAKGD